MKRIVGIGLAILLASSAWAQLPVGRVIPTDNFAISHISGTVHVVLLSSGHANVTRDHISSSFRAWRVANCGTGATLAINTNPDRRDLLLQNLGGPSTSGTHNNLYLGFGTQGHVALTINNGWVLHSMGYIAGGSGPFTGSTASLTLPNYQGPVACIAEAAGTQLSIIEILR